MTCCKESDIRVKVNLNKRVDLSEVHASRLLHHDINLVTILHLECLGRIILFDSLSIKNEAALVVAQSLSLTVRIHQFLQLSLLLDLEKDFSTVLRLHFDVQLLACCSCICFTLLLLTWVH